MATTHRLLAILLLASTCAVAQDGNDLTAEELKGKVREVTEVLYSDEGQTRPCMKTVDKYNAKGFLTDEVHNDYILKVNARKVLKYTIDAKGNIAGINEQDDAGKVVRTVEYEYDSSDRVRREVEHMHYDGDTNVNKTDYTYDQLGNKKEERTYTNDTADRRTVYTYDEKGRLSTVKTYDKADKMIILYEYNYLGYAKGVHWAHCEKEIHGVRTHIFRTLDGKGQLTEKTIYVKDFSKETKERYSDYDNHGNWLKQATTGNVPEAFYIVRSVEYYR